MSGLPFPDEGEELELDPVDQRIVAGLAQLREMDVRPIALRCHPDNAGRAAPYAAAHGLELLLDPELPLNGPEALRIRWEGEAPDLGEREEEAWKR